MAVQHRSRSYASSDAPVEGVDQYQAKYLRRRQTLTGRQANMVDRESTSLSFDAAVTAKGWSNERVARWLGVDEKTVRRWRAGVARVGIRHLLALKALGLEVEL